MGSFLLPDDAPVAPPAHYIGSELEIFREATNWKAYVGRQLARYIGGSVLEVGAGLGANIQMLMNGNVRGWLALEPDPAQAVEIGAQVAAGRLPAHCRVQTGTLADLSNTEQFDTILYIDVLEHIDDDRGEVAKAERLLAPGGRLIVLAPAHQALFTDFDRAIGHFRRYNMAGLRRITPDHSVIEKLFMLDSVGFFASLANRLLLRQSMPTKGQILTWDRLMVPLSRMLDPLTRFSFGKSVVIVWQKARN
jgi:SAM-dependent methyltransferase